jgi:3-oxoacyl-(acyl-carrier-protein) synthase/thioester reductase-like protein/acyl carrier protein
MKDSIAIIGVSFDLPNIKNWNDLKASLSDSTSFISDMPADRLKEIKEAFGITEMAKAGYLDEIDMFDNEYFGFTERESLKMFPEHRLFLTNAMKAFYHAGYTKTDLEASNTGIFYTSSRSLYTNYDGISNVSFSHFDFVKGIEGTILAKYLDTRGPVIAIDTSCSSSLTAINTAKHSLNAGECDMALVGAVKTLALTKDALRTNVVHSQKGTCKPFDEDADGMVNGEGVIFFLLKQYEKALADGDAILGEIRGIALNHGGSRISSLTAPSSEAQKEVILQAWQNAGININDISYIEAHGTGTILGDPIEVEGIKQAFFSAPDNYEKNPCALSSFKGQIGHLDYLSGLAGLLRLLAALRYKIIPLQSNFNTLNSHFNMEGTGIYIPKKTTSWDSASTERIGGVSSFGMTGTNVHVVVSQKEGINQKQLPNQKYHYVQLSQNSPEKLERFKQYLLSKINNCSSFDEILEIGSRLNKTFEINTENQGILYTSKGSLLNSLQNEQKDTIAPQIILLLDLEIIQYSKEDVRQIFIENAFIKAQWATHVSIALESIENQQLLNIFTQFTIYKYLFEKFGVHIKFITPKEDSVLNKLIKSRVTISEIYNSEIAYKNTHGDFNEDSFKKYMQANFSNKNVCILDFSNRSKDRFNELELDIETLSGSFLEKDRYKTYCKILAKGANPLKQHHNPETNAIELPYFEPKRYWPKLKKKVALKNIAEIIPEKKQIAHNIDKKDIHNKIREIWTFILEIDDFDDTADFFELGGTSLSALDMIDEIKKVFAGVKITYEDIYVFASVAKLTDEIHRQIQKQFSTANIEVSKPEYSIDKIKNVIREVWEAILEIDDFTDTDDFFELGGTSLSALDMVDEVKMAFQNIKISYEEIFIYNTISKLTKFVEKNLQDQFSVAPAESKNDEVLEKENSNREIKETFETRENKYQEVIQKLKQEEFSKEIPEKILITGGTGLVGLGMIHHLIQNSESDLYCIVRKKDFNTADERFWSIFDRYYDSSEIDTERIHIIAGDVSKKALGITVSDVQFNSIGLIFHIAGTPQFVSHKSTYEHINYIGTKNVVDWANAHQIKKISFVSTVGMVGETMPESIKNFYETDGDVGQKSTKLIHGASKLIAEEYIRNHYNHESKIFRVSNIGGGYVNGVFPTDLKKNLMWLRLKSLAELGYYSKELLDESSGVSYIPNDILSIVISEISFANIKNLHTFHIRPKRSFSNKEILTALQNAGVELKKINYKEFISYIERNYYKINFHQIANKEKTYNYRSEATQIVFSKLHLQEIINIHTQDYLNKIIHANLQINRK